MNTTVVQEPGEKVQIFISCRKLKDMDILSKSDPEVEVAIKTGKNGGYRKLGKTECIQNNLNPDFTKNFTVDYYFEKEQTMKFDVYDVDSATSRDYIGSIEVPMGKIMGSQK